MKKGLFLFTLLVVLQGFSAFAASKTVAPAASPKFAVSVDALGILLDDFSGSFEAVITPDISLKANVSYSPNFFWISNWNLLSVQLEGRYYFGRLITALPDFLKGPALKGLFAGIGLGWDSVGYSYSDSVDNFKGNYSTADIFLDAGEKYFFTPSFFVEGTVGYDLVFPGTWTWTDNGTTVASYSFSSTFSPGGLLYNVSIGWAF